MKNSQTHSISLILTALAIGITLSVASSKALGDDPNKNNVLSTNQVSPVYWKKAWSEEFNSTGGGDTEACYLGRAKCVMKENEQPSDCPDTTETSLSKLNKCVWTVNSHDDALSGGVNIFSPAEIMIANGELTLTTKATAKETGKENDKTSFASGSITTKPFEYEVITPPSMQTGGDTPKIEKKKTGFNFTYGRIEVRAWLPQGAGAMPMINLLPVKKTAEWPFDGEIVGIESTPEDQNKAISKFFSADRETKTALSKTIVGPSKNNNLTRPEALTFTDDWHVYAIEWSPLEIRYYVDQWQVGSVREGELIKAMKADKTHRANIPNSDFYISITNRVAAFKDLAAKYRADASKYSTQKLRIDYIRLYSTCSVDPSAQNGVSKDCMENTLNPQCLNPCDGVGRFDGYGCLVAFAPEEYKTKHSKGKFYFHPDKLGGNLFKINCPSGAEFIRGKGCYAGDVPAGHEGFALTSEELGGRFYVKPKCQK